MKLISIFLCWLHAFFSLAQTKQVSDIIIIHVPEPDRDKIATLVEKLNQSNPKVLAIDIRFTGTAKPTRNLMAALLRTKNLVMVSVIDEYSEKKQSQSGFVPVNPGEFMINAKTGFVNLIEDQYRGRDVVNRASLHEQINGKLEYSFGVQCALLFDSITASGFLKIHSKVISVDYSSYLGRFKVVDGFRYLERQGLDEDFRNKILILGFRGPGETDLINIVKGNTICSVYGIEHHACVIANILDLKNKQTK